MTTTSTDSRKAALFARTSTATLVASALTLSVKTDLTSEERLTLAWIHDEIETRMGGVQDEDAFVALLDNDLSYIECLLVTFPELVA